MRVSDEGLGGNPEDKGAPRIERVARANFAFLREGGWFFDNHAVGASPAI